MHPSKSVQENEIHHWILARRPDLGVINKKRHCKLEDFVIQVNQSEKIDKYLDLARELKKTVENEIDDNTNSNLCTRNSSQRLGGKKTGGNENQRDNRDHSNCST